MLYDSATAGSDRVTFLNASAKSQLTDCFSGIHRGDLDLADKASPR